MSTLHAASTLGALPDGHIKAPHDRLDAGKVFLVLRRDVKQVQCPATPRTRRGKRGRVGRIDAGGNRAPCPAPIPAAGPSPRLPTAALGPILGERRGLPEPGPSRGRELLLQPLVLPLQPIVRTLQPIILTSQLIVLTSQLIMLTLHLIPFPGRARRDLLQPRDLFVVVALPFGPLVVDGMRAFIGHARFMADSRQKYKYKIVISTDSPAKRRPFRFESNSDGFRTKELEPKPPDVARIVTQGDSSTFGWGVHETYTYQRLLEDRLNRQPGNVEVLNLGMPGQTSRHGRAVFDHYARTLNPDLLIISFGANDARYVLEPAHVVLGRDEGWRGSVRQALMRFETFRLMRRLLVAVRDPFTVSGERASAEGDRRELVNSVPIDAYKANLHYLIEQGRSIGAEAVLLSVCAPPQWSSAMGEVAEEAGVPLVDALELFRAHLDDLREHRLYSAEVRYAESIYGRQAMQENWRLYVTTDGCHPGLAGHSLIADALAESINSLDWR